MSVRGEWSKERLQSLRIWDLHCHLNGAAGRTPDEKMAKVISVIDRLGIERIITFMGWPFSQDPSAERLIAENDMVLQALSHWHDRAFGFVYVSGNHVETSLKEIDRCVANGPMIGLKLWVARRCNDPALTPILQRAEELNAVVYQHTWFKTDGNYQGESTPMEFAEMARRHPKLRLILGHTGGNWEIGVRAVRDLPHVSIDLAGFDPTAGVTEYALRELGPSRLIYGSDACGRSFASQLSKVLSADLDDPTRRLILGDNLRRLLGPIMKQKGLNP